MAGNVRWLFENRIQRGNYRLDTILHLIDMYHIEGKLTDDDCNTLRVMAAERDTGTMDAETIMHRIEELEKRLATLETGMPENTGEGE